MMRPVTELLKLKHPEGREANEDVVLQGPLPPVENIIFDVIDDTIVLETAKITCKGSGPSGMNADGWRRILISQTMVTMMLIYER